MVPAYGKYVQILCTNIIPNEVTFPPVLILKIKSGGVHTFPFLVHPYCGDHEAYPSPSLDSLPSCVDAA